MSLDWETHDKAGYRWQLVRGLDCEISLEPRPHYCDRGDWIAKIQRSVQGDYYRLNLDNQDGWPRYYFDQDRAKLEIEAWLKKRKQMPIKNP